MKKIAILCLAAFAATASYAQAVRFGEPSIEKEGETVTVRFRADIGGKAVKRNYSLICSPEITGGGYRWSLPAIIVQGRGSKVLLERRILASGNGAKFDGVLFAKNGQRLEYIATAPYQGWMDGAALAVETVGEGCCSTGDPAFEILAGNILPRPEPEPVIVPEPVLTTGDRMAQTASFVTPYAQFEELERQGLLFDEDRDNAVVIHYGVGKYDIVPDYADNRRTLAGLAGSIRTIEQSADSEVAVIVVAGFSSPEGNYELNDRLAWNRAMSFKEYLIAHTGMPSDRIKVYNGSTDWQGLRLLVEASDMPRKATVVDIIDNVPVWDAQRKSGRLGELMRLDDGRPYRHMRENFFPKLRNAAYIRIYYRNK